MNFDSPKTLKELKQTLKQVEIRSYGKLISGITIDQLSEPHLSKLRNQLIAETFHRTGAVEIWGRGTNRISNECRRYDVPLPIFEEKQGFLVVTFKIPIIPTQPESQPESLSRKVLEMLDSGHPLSKAEISLQLGQKKISGTLNQVIRELIQKGSIQYTLPEKPNSRLQKYKTKKAL